MKVYIQVNNLKYQNTFVHNVKIKCAIWASILNQLVVQMKDMGSNESLVGQWLDFSL
jgi:hypothetical protein